MLRQLAVSIQHVLEQPTATARLRRVLDEKADLERELFLLRKLEELERAGSLDQAAQIASFAEHLSSVDSETAQQLATLLAAEDLPSVWRELLDHYEAARTAYERRYRELHGEVRERAITVSEELRSHARSDQLAAEISALASLACGEKEPSIEPPSFRCPVCRRSIAELERDLLRLDREHARLLQVFATQEVDVDRNGRPEPLALAKNVEQAGDLDGLVVRLRAYAATALDHGPLEVRIEAELRDGE